MLLLVILAAPLLILPALLWLEQLEVRLSTPMSPPAPRPPRRRDVDVPAVEPSTAWSPVPSS